jgi:hypothetical protein
MKMVNQHHTIKMLNKLLCPITGDELIYVGHDERVFDGNSYYSPKSNNTIIFAVHPFSRNIYVQVNNKSLFSHGFRWFKLLEDNTWQELKQVPHGDILFPIEDESDEWVNACRLAEEKHQKRLEKQEYWKQHPDEDPRIHAKTLANEKVSVSPLGPPTGILYYVDSNSNPDEDKIPEIDLKMESKEVKSGVIYVPYRIINTPYMMISDKDGTRRVWNTSKKKILLYYLYKFTRITWFINQYLKQ